MLVFQVVLPGGFCSTLSEKHAWETLTIWQPTARNRLSVFCPCSAFRRLQLCSTESSRKRRIH